MDKNKLHNNLNFHGNKDSSNLMNNEYLEKRSEEAWNRASSTIDESIKNEIWLNIQYEVDRTLSISEKNSNVSNRCFYSILKYAACIAIILCSYFASYMLYNHFYKTTENNLYCFAVEAGQKGSIRLADGTLVHLNSLSKITFSNDYNTDDRLVTLDGEAYFEVAKNPNKKFIVSCNGIEIEALGTQFNVKAYPTDSVITTTLAEGKVKVSSNEQCITLNPNDVATYNVKQHAMNASKIDDISIADYWRSEKLVFASEPLSSIAKTIERMYGVKIDIKDPSLNTMKFTGTIQNNSLNIVMDVISLSYPLTYTITDSIITISAKHNVKQ